ncbi:MAG: carbon-nitrogen hydrolase family protein [Pseudomonadota bacterium]
MTAFKAACVQLRSGLDPAANVAAACELIEEAAAQGASLVATPEMTHVVDLRPRRLCGVIAEEDRTEALTTFRDLAARLNIWLLIGSLAVKLGERRAANRSFLIAPSGVVAARYDKLHMFDVDLDGGESYRESNVYQAGAAAVVAHTPSCVLGLSICYDVRFPHLYRALARAGASVMAVPAAFTRQTGEAHWHVLLRARAIETGSFVIAPAQGGRHEDGRETFGHSLIVDPRGRVLAEKDDDAPGFVLAEIRPEEAEAARRRIPNLGVDTPFQIQQIDAS